MGKVTIGTRAHKGIIQFNLNSFVLGFKAIV